MRRASGSGADFGPERTTATANPDLTRKPRERCSTSLSRRRGGHTIQLHDLRTVRQELCGGRRDDFERQSLSVDSHDDEVVRIVLLLATGPDDVLDADLVARAGGQILLEIWFAAIRIDRRAAAAGHYFVHSMRTRRVLVPFDPVFEQV